VQEITQVNNLPSAASNQDTSTTVRTTYHIYHEKNRHRRIQTTIDLDLESPRSAARCAAKEKVQTRTVDETDASQSFFFHKPYLAFHSPPLVLHAGSTKHGPPVLLIHSSAFWRKYKIQYGDSLAAADVLDPRGVVAFSHHGGNKPDQLKADDTKLKGYKVRTWRLWGESGKDYVRQVREERKHGRKRESGPQRSECGDPVRADGVVYLKWSNPFSLCTRQYHFHYASIDFYWKGTSSVKKRGFFGMFVRFNHLKIVAAIHVPSPVETGAEPAVREVCLGRYVSSVSKKKCGRLELYDGVIARLVEEHSGKKDGEQERGRDETLERRKVCLVRIIVATAICMIAAEKEKREAVGQWLEHAGEGGG
jgi:hypothetical protein